MDLVLSVVCALFIARALCALLHNIRFWSDSKLCSLYADVCLCVCVCVCGYSKIVCSNQIFLQLAAVWLAVEAVMMKQQK